jgi:hypothetical protein
MNGGAMAPELKAKLFGAWSLELKERPRAWDELPNQTHQETGDHAAPNEDMGKDWPWQQAT